MRKTAMLAAALALLLTAATVEAGTDAIDPAIASATVLIERTDMKQGTCTGVLVAPDVVATAAHCLEDKPIEVLAISIGGTRQMALSIVERGETREASKSNRTMQVSQARRDWLLIRIAPVDVAPVEVSVPSAAEVRAAALARGILVPSYSKKQLHLVTPCSLRQQIGEGQVADIFALVCSLRGGDSGAPVFLLTDDGPRLIGLVMTSANKDGISFAVSVNQFAHLLP